MTLAQGDSEHRRQGTTGCRVKEDSRLWSLWLAFKSMSRHHLSHGLLWDTWGSNMNPPSTQIPHWKNHLISRFVYVCSVFLVCLFLLNVSAKKVLTWILYSKSNANELNFPVSDWKDKKKKKKRIQFERKKIKSNLIRSNRLIISFFFLDSIVNHYIKDFCFFIKIVSKTCLPLLQQNEFLVIQTHCCFL